MSFMSVIPFLHLQFIPLFFFKSKLVFMFHASCASIDWIFNWGGNLSSNCNSINGSGLAFLVFQL